MRFARGQRLVTPNTRVDCKRNMKGGLGSEEMTETEVAQRPGILGEKKSMRETKRR